MMSDPVAALEYALEGLEGSRRVGGDQELL